MSNEMYLEQNRTVLPIDAQQRIQSFYYLCKPFLGPGLAIDLGAGTGTLAELIRRDGYICDEMDFYPRDQTISFLDLNRPVLPSTNKLYSNIFLTHVLEHLDNPATAIQKIIQTYAATGARLFFAWPDPAYPDSKHRPLDKSIGHYSQLDLVSVRATLRGMNAEILLTGQFCSQKGYEELVAIARC